MRENKYPKYMDFCGGGGGGVKRMCMIREKSLDTPMSATGQYHARIHGCHCNNTSL